MPKLRLTKNNFTAGEIAPDLYGRPDLAAYANGAARLRNVLIRPTGGVARRPGLRHVAALPGAADEGLRLTAFAFNTEQTYLLVFTAGEMRVFRDDVLTTMIATPWSAAQLAQLAWVQNADTLFVCHPDVPPQRITRTGHAAWTIAPFAFRAEPEVGSQGGVLRVPGFKFAPDAVTLQPSGISGTVTLTASEAVFLPGHVGTRFRVKRKELRITALLSAAQAEAQVIETLADTQATRDWEEQAFSDLRGWPVAVTLFQERLVFAGAREAPNRVWMSKTGDLANFDLGKALDDEAIEFALLSDQVDAIRAVTAGRHLQIFTSGAEWMVSGEPLTPTKLRADRQTRVGSLVERNIAPVLVDGATLFVARNGRELRQFLYADVDQAYSADDTALVAPHILRDPRDMAYSAARKLILLPLGDGRLAVQTNYRAQGILAWTVLQTAGDVRAVAVMDDAIYAAVARAGGLGLERFDEACFTDAALLAEGAEPRRVWDGLAHLEGRLVRVRADGADRGDHAVAQGRVTLAAPARRVEIGLPFAHEIAPLPAEIGGDGAAMQTAPLRLVRAVFRLQDTAAFAADLGDGLKPRGFARLDAAALDAPPAPFTGDRELRGLGWSRGLERPLWRIAQDAAQPFTLLSVVTEVKGTD